MAIDFLGKHFIMSIVYFWRGVKSVLCKQQISLDNCCTDFNCYLHLDIISINRGWFVAPIDKPSNR